MTVKLVVLCGRIEGTEAFDKHFFVTHLALAAAATGGRDAEMGSSPRPDRACYERQD